MDLVTAAALGTAVGVATGLLPGLHVNTIAAVVFAIMPDAALAGAAFLLAVGIVHTIVNILPATYLGAPDDDDVVAVLPAHRLLLAGRAAEAVSVSVAASLTGVLAACALAFAVHALLVSEVMLGRIDAVTPWVLAVVLVVLWLQEAHRGVWGPIKALLVSVLAGLLGLVGAKIPLVPWVPVPPSSLLPLLGGLFGAAGLSMALQRPPLVPWQPDLPQVARRPTPALVGSLLAGVTALMPGLTSAVATALVPRIRGRPLHAVAAMSAINTAHAVLAIVVWLTTQRVRTGLADAMDHWVVASWVGPLPGPTAAVWLGVILGAACVGAAATMALDHALRRHADRFPSQALSATGLVFLTAVVAVLSGWSGLAFYAIAMLLGRLPLHLGVRRVHLVACLILPVLWWRLA